MHPQSTDLVHLVRPPSSARRLAAVGMTLDFSGSLLNVVSPETEAVSNIAWYNDAHTGAWPLKGLADYNVVRILVWSWENLEYTLTGGHGTQVYMALEAVDAAGTPLHDALHPAASWLVATGGITHPGGGHSDTLSQLVAGAQWDRDVFGWQLRLSVSPGLYDWDVTVGWSTPFNVLIFLDTTNPVAD